MRARTPALELCVKWRKVSAPAGGRCWTEVTVTGPELIPGSTQTENVRWNAYAALANDRSVRRCDSFRSYGTLRCSRHPACVPSRPGWLHRCLRRVSFRRFAAFAAEPRRNAFIGHLAARWRRLSSVEVPKLPKTAKLLRASLELYAISCGFSAEEISPPGPSRCMAAHRPGQKGRANPPRKSTTGRRSRPAMDRQLGPIILPPVVPVCSLGRRLWQAKCLSGSVGALTHPPSSDGCRIRRRIAG